MSSTKILVVVLAIIAVALVAETNALPSIGKRLDAMGGVDFIQICLNNCAQCKKMFGNYFQGQACAEACLKYKGKSIPDCEDIVSISPYLNTFE